MLLVVLICLLVYAGWIELLLVVLWFPFLLLLVLVWMQGVE